LTYYISILIFNFRRHYQKIYFSYKKINGTKAVLSIIKPHPKAAPSLFPVLRTDNPVLPVHNHLCQRQPDSEAGSGGIFAAVEALEKMRQVFGGNPWTFVVDGNLRVQRVRTAGNQK